MRFKNFHMHLKIQQETVRIFPTPILVDICSSNCYSFDCKCIIAPEAHVVKSLLKIFSVDITKKQ